MKNIIKFITATNFRQNIAVFFLFFVSLFAVFWPGLVGRGIFTQRFTLTLIYPTFNFVSDSLKIYGNLPLWLNYLNGAPSYLSQYGLFHPLNIFYKFFDFILVYNWFIFINFLFAGFFVYLLAKTLNLSKNASFVAGIVYVFSEINLRWGMVNVVSSAVFFIPLLFLCLFKIYRAQDAKNKLTFFFIGAANLIVAFLSALAQLVIYGILGAFLFSIFLDINFYDKTKNLFKNLKATKIFLLMIVFSFLIVSPWIFSVLNFINLSTRSSGIEASGQDVMNVFLRPGDLINLFIPNVDIPDYFQSPAFLFGQIPLYFGALPLFLVIFSLFILKNQRDGIILFFAGLFAFVVLTQFKFFHFYDALHKLPLLKMFRGVEKWLYLGSLSASVLAAYGLDNLCKFKESVFFKRFSEFLKYFIICVVLFFVFFNAFFMIYHSKILNKAYDYFDSNIFNASKGLSLDYYHLRIKSFFYGFFGNFSFLNFKFDVALAFLISSLFLFGYYKKNKISDEIFKKLSSVFIILNFILIYQGFFDFLPSDILRKRPGVVEFLKSDKNVFRIERAFLDYYYEYLRSYKDNSDKIFNIETLASNLPLAHKVDSIRGDDNLIFSRQLDLTGGLNKIAAEDGVAADDSNVFSFLNVPDIQRRTKIYSSAKAQKLLGMMNVKYLLVPMELKPARPAGGQWKKVFQTQVTQHNIPVYIYENPEVLPRVYFAKNIETPSPFLQDSQILAELLAIQDFKKQTLIECPTEDTLCQFSIFNSQFSNPDSIEIQELRPGYLRLKTKTTSPRWLVYSESNLPTWEARFRSLQPPTFNFQPLKIYAANYIYQAVFIPEGENEVIFEYPGLFRQMRYAIEELVF